MTAVEIVTTVSSIAGMVTKITELIKTARDKPSKEAAKAIESVVDATLSLQNKLLQLQAEAITLQEENAALRSQVREYERRTLQRDNYERRRIGRSVVMVAKDDPETYLCPTCFEAERLVYLDRLSRSFAAFGTHRCSSCEATFDVR